MTGLHSPGEATPAPWGAEGCVITQTQGQAAGTKVPHEPRLRGPHSRWLTWGLESSVLSLRYLSHSHSAESATQAALPGSWPRPVLCQAESSRPGLVQAQCQPCPENSDGQVLRGELETATCPKESPK